MAIEVDGKVYDVVEQGKRFRWTPAKDMLLTDLYRKGSSPSELAQRFRCREGLIFRRLRVLDLSGEKLWTAKNDKLLRDNYRRMSNVELGEKIGCVHFYVGDRLAYLGLQRKKGRPKTKKK